VDTQRHRPRRPAVTIDFADLSDLPMVERVITIACVSNQVGGDLIGTAKWLGTPLGDLLRRAGVRPEASQVVGRSVDGFTVGFPTDAVFDGRDALVAIGMNDEPLPFEHGFPARLIVAGLYGYVSATKWLSEIELTTWDAFDAYWVPRGWSKEGPIKTQSRIDTPRGAPARNRPVRFGGVAWAPTRGIAGRGADGWWGGWKPSWASRSVTTCGGSGPRVGGDAWHPPGAGAGHRRRRCHPDRGDQPVAPDGATGYHTITYLVVNDA
jgi:DMSO/TMAO reductase YedYZ molybdopterin-dependent catalytic subunit